jgi:hypothetical protein
VTLPYLYGFVSQLFGDIFSQMIFLSLDTAEWFLKISSSMQRAIGRHSLKCYYQAALSPIENVMREDHQPGSYALEALQMPVAYEHCSIR